MIDLPQGYLPNNDLTKQMALFKKKTDAIQKGKIRRHIKEGWECEGEERRKETLSLLVVFQTDFSYY